MGQWDMNGMIVGRGFLMGISMEILVNTPLETMVDLGSFHMSWEIGGCAKNVNRRWNGNMDNPPIRIDALYMFILPICGNMGMIYQSF